MIKVIRLISIGVPDWVQVKKHILQQTDTTVGQSLHEEIVLTAVCGKLVETVIQACQPGIVNFQELTQLICRWPYLSIDR